MRRRLFTFCSAVSLVMCVAVCVLWVRSYWRTDSITRQSLDGGWHADRNFPLDNVFELGVNGGTRWQRYVASSRGMLRVGKRKEFWDAGAYVDLSEAPGEWARGHGVAVEVARNAHRSEHRLIGVALWTYEAGELRPARWYGYQTWETHFPHALIAVITAIAATPLLLKTRSAFRRRSRIQQRRCPTCGYDLRATPDRCPECGATPRADAPTAV